MTRLRLVAAAIAIAAAIDPAIAVTGAIRPRLAVVAAPRSAVAVDVRARLVRSLSPSFDIVPAITSDTAVAVVIGDRYPAEPVSASLLVATVTTPPAAISGARIAHVAAPMAVPNASLIHLDVDVDRAGATAPPTDVTAAIAGLEVGRASHVWAAAETRWRASVDAVPVGDPPYQLRITAGRSIADVVVDTRRAPFRVEFYDPRPSWAATFVRRALEADARFQIAALGFTSRGISTQTGGAVPVADPRLDAFDVVIAGGLNRLTAADTRALERFMRQRGGAVVVLPDQRIGAGAARDFVDLAFDERLLEQPATLTVSPPAASLRASELLVLRALAPGTAVVGRLPASPWSPVITSAPRGGGRLLFSGAMDAWRFRAADHAAFDRFWQSTIAGLALAAPPPIAIDVAPPILRPGDRAEVRVRLRSTEVTAVSASLDDQPVRLLPEPESGAFRGAFVARGTAGRAVLKVRAIAGEAITASRTLLVQPDARPVPASREPPLALLSSSHRGIDVTPDRLSELERFVRGAVAIRRAPIARRPMRSAWWMVPFAACLSAEWWLRRRRGRR